MQRRQGIQLAYPFEEKRLYKWGFPVLVQPKLDGDRCRAIIDNEGICTLLSSEEHIITSVPHINQELESMGIRGIELDGELYIHGRSHQEIHGLVGRSRNVSPDHTDVEYHVFDVAGGEPQIKRTIALSHINFIKNVVRVPSFTAGSFTEVMDILDMFIRTGYEGMIVRNITYPYLRKRSTGMMKLKPRKEDHYLIIGYEEEISKDGTPKDALGALVLQSDAGHVFKVGSGSFLTRENRVNLWKAKENIVGKIAQIKYQHLTERRIPRFPVLIDIV